jgi:hypothetical protein
MQKTSVNMALALGLLMAVALACNFTTANISNVKIGKDKAVSQESTTFGGNDAVYVVATISNAPGKVKVKGRVNFEDVEGQKPGPVPGLETTVDLDGSGTAIYTFTPPPEGWPKGKYKVDVILTTDSGEQKDLKSVSFTTS